MINETNITTALNAGQQAANQVISSPLGQDLMSRTTETVSGLASWLGSIIAPTLGLSPEASLFVVGLLTGMGVYAMYFKSYEWTMIAIALIALFIIL